MKRSTMRLAVVSACVGAGLVLSACGGGSEGEDTGTATEEQAGSEDAAAEDAPAEEAAAPATEEDLTAAVEAGGFTAQVADPADTEGLAGAMGEMSVEPEECEAFMNAGLAAAGDSDLLMVIGTPSDAGATTSAAALGYPSADEAAGTLESSTSSLEACSDITITMQGMEVQSSTTEVDATVEGADSVIATEVAMDLSGQEMTTTSVQASKGSAIVNVTGAGAPGAEAPSVDELSQTAADMIAALP